MSLDMGAVMRLIHLNNFNIKKNCIIIVNCGLKLRISLEKKNCAIYNENLIGFSE